MRFLVVVMLLAAPGTARADIFVIPFMGVKFGGSTSIVDLELAAGRSTLTLGATALKLDDRIIGWEVEFAHIPRYFENSDQLPLMKTGSYVSDLTGSVVLALPPGLTGGGLRPYVVAGGGVIHAEAADFLEIFLIRRTVPAINLGIGATGLLSNNVGVRFDVRHLRSLTKDDPLGLVGRKIVYSRFTIGLLLRL
jgi:hypothetical protein